MTTRLRVRVMDTDNGGIGWTETTLEVEMPVLAEGESSDDYVLRVAKAVNRAQYQDITDGDLEEGDEAPGEVVRAAGDESHGIAWLDDKGHQGATNVLLEWHRE